MSFKFLNFKQILELEMTFQVMLAREEHGVY